MGSTKMRTVVASCAVVSAAAAVALGAAGSVSAAPPPTPVVQEFDYRFDGATISGDPWPFSVEALRATTGVEPGVVRLQAGPLCNVFVPTMCATYSHPIQVTWFNFATGQSGSTTVTDDGVNVNTGIGPVGLAGQVGRLPIWPNLGVVNA